MCILYLSFFSKAAWGDHQSAREDHSVNETGVLDDALGLRRLDPPGIRFLGHVPVDETETRRNALTSFVSTVDEDIALQRECGHLCNASNSFAQQGK